MKKHLLKFLFLFAVSTATALPLQAGEHNRLLQLGSSLAENLKSRCQSAWQKATVWQKNAVAIGAGVVLATGAGYVSYNSEGK
jgi:hypothetical protein